MRRWHLLGRVPGGSRVGARPAWGQLGNVDLPQVRGLSIESAGSRQFRLRWTTVANASGHPLRTFDVQIGIQRKNPTPGQENLGDYIPS